MTGYGYTDITACRVCGNNNLEKILCLGKQALTGVFPSAPDKQVTKGPVTLVKCHGQGDSCCHLVQLKQSYDAKEMYGENYGYRSGLNASMVQHLQQKVGDILKNVNLQSGDIILDIGSNDGTTLGFYPHGDWKLVGMDPVGEKFKPYYKPHINLIAEFFSAKNFQREFGKKKAKIITSFSIFYDLEDPVAFARDVSNMLASDGIWVMEQSYMPKMLSNISYDTACHEHLEYYGLRQIEWIAKKVGMKLVDVSFNDINGGSFSVVLANKEHRDIVVYQDKLNAVLESELLFETLGPFQKFAMDVEASRETLVTTLTQLKANRKTVFGLGASTKGNVVLQYAGITPDLLPAIGEVNPDKFGCYTPGTLIPILPETEILAKKPDYLLLLPWHFWNSFENDIALNGISLIHPLNASLNIQK